MNTKQQAEKKKVMANDKRRLTAIIAAVLLQGTFANASNQPVAISSACETRAGRQLYEAVSAGNVRMADQLLNSGAISVDNVIIAGLKLPNGHTLSEPDGRLGCQAFSPSGAFSDGSVYYHAAGETVSTYGWSKRTTTHLYGTALMTAVRNRNVFMVKELLKRGANPNVFINVGSVVFKNSMVKAQQAASNGTVWFGGKPYGGPLDDMFMPRSATGDAKAPNPVGDIVDYAVTRLCALTDLYGTGTSKTLQQDDAIAEMLVNAGAGFPTGEDDRGRTALWDVAAVRSVYLLGLLHANGWDVNHKDHMGKTVADYCVATLEKMPECDDRAMLVRFVEELGRLGCNVPSAMPEPQRIEVRPLGGNGGATQRQVPGENPGIGGSPVAPDLINTRASSDRAMERQAIQNQIDALRIELEDARRNLHNDIVQGTGWVSASMHEQGILREIQELQGQLMRLR